MCIANEFLAMGFAVAMPAHPGVGRSEGTYQRYMSNTGVFVGSATGLLQKGRNQLDESMAALDFLKTLPIVDTSRVVMMGLSAGGFAVSCLGFDIMLPA